MTGRTNKIKHHNVNKFKTELEKLKQTLYSNNWFFIYFSNESQWMRHLIHYLQNLKLASGQQSMSGLLFANCVKILDFLAAGKAACNSNKYLYWKTFRCCCPTVDSVQAALTPFPFQNLKTLASHHTKSIFTTGIPLSWLHSCTTAYTRKGQWSLYAATTEPCNTWWQVNQWSKASWEISEPYVFKFDSVKCPVKCCKCAVYLFEFSIFHSLNLEWVYLLFCHICSNASASSTLLISSESWNFRKPFPPWPVTKTNGINKSVLRAYIKTIINNRHPNKEQSHKEWDYNNDNKQKIICRYTGTTGNLEC